MCSLLKTWILFCVSFVNRTPLIIRYSISVSDLCVANYNIYSTKKEQFCYSTAIFKNISLCQKLIDILILSIRTDPIKPNRQNVKIQLPWETTAWIQYQSTSFFINLLEKLWVICLMTFYNNNYLLRQMITIKYDIVSLAKKYWSALL